MIVFQLKNKSSKKIAMKTTKLVKLNRAEQLLINAIRDEDDFDEFVRQVKTMESGLIKTQLLNVAID